MDSDFRSVLSQLESLVAAEGRVEGWEDLLNRALASGFRIRRSDGTRPTTGKTQMIEDVRRGAPLTRKIDVDRTVIDVDERLAVAITVIEVSGDDLEPAWFENALTFERQHGTWVCTRWHSTGMPKPGGELFCGDDSDDVVGMQRLFGTSPDLRASRVFFPAGTRTFWHTHSGRQVLSVTGGAGLLQRDGDFEPVSLRPGMSEETGAHVAHWHGATAESWVEHVAVTDGKTEPCKDRPCPEL